MLERSDTVRGAAFICSTCNRELPAGSRAHVQHHVEVSQQACATIHVGFAPNESPPRVIVAVRMTPSVAHKRAKGHGLVITRKECDECDMRARLATTRRNCFI
jgi:hypothetical protein